MPNSLSIQNLDDTQYSKGYVYLTIEDTGETPDGVPAGSLQNISLTMQRSLVEMMGPEQLVAHSVGQGALALTGSFGWGVILPSQIKALMGWGEVTHAGGRTTATLMVDSEPAPFHLHCLSNADADLALEVMLFNCLSTNMQVMEVGDTHAFVMQSADFTVYGKKLGSDVKATLAKMVWPGNKTASNVSQPGNTNSNDVPDVLEPDA